jgi:hypothetical protein
VVVVEDARYFTDGFGIGTGDLIVVGVNRAARITKVDYAARSLTLENDISWNAGDAVGYPYSGTAPDIGAQEYLASGDAPPDPPTGLRVVSRQP